MARHTWTRQHLIAGFSPYATWARESVDALWWLADLVDWAYSGSRANLGEHGPDMVDIAHTRWALGTAKTAIDLCAADAAVGHHVKPFWVDGPEQEEFAWQLLPEKLHECHRTELRENIEAWLAALLDDADYKSLKAARDAFTHRMTVRSALIRIRPAQDHEERTLFAVHIPSVEGRPDARALILFARDVATRQVEAFCAAASR